jgi:hypothetical protein
MKEREELTGSSMSSKYGRIPHSAVLINTTVAIIVFGLGIYHFTRPEGAWRSGITEVLCAALLLTAAYMVNWSRAMLINLIVAAVSFGMGVRHLSHGGGWKSGVTELFLTVVLIAVVGIIYRYRKAKKSRSQHL